MNNKRVKGLWFFGMSGSGKTYQSKILKIKLRIVFWLMEML